jgi:putative phosphoesterase
VKVGVIADTHLTGYDGRLERILDHHFSGAELILHAGDLTDISVLDLFGQKEVRAVYGNTDPPPVRHLLCDKLILDVQGFRLGLIHGCGTPTQIEETITAQFDCVDCILYFNPGSATCNRFTPYGTVGVLDIGKTITGEIIALQDH